MRRPNNKGSLAYLLALVAAFALVAASCGSDDDDAADETETEAASTDEAEEADESGDAEAEGDDATDDADAAAAEGGTLIIGTTQVARHVNGTVQSGLATAVPGTQIFASPLLVDADYNFSSYLADTWEWSDDGLSLTLNLVDNATFHDGEAVTSEDVKFSIETAQAGHPFKPMFAPVSSVDTPDDTTVVINLSQPHPALLLALTPPLLPVIPEHIFNDGQDMADHPRNSEDVIGSGPFKLTEFNPSEVIRLEANPDFFLGAPKLDEIIIQTFPDENTVTLSLENGEINMAALSSFLNIERLKGVDGLTITNDGHHGLGALNWVEFNVDDPLLSSKEVRQAIAYAIDADRITALNGDVFPRSPGPIAATSPFFHDGIESYDYDTAKAAELLEAAGYSGGEGLELTIDYLPGPDAIQKNVAEYIVQALEDVGITTTISVSPDFPTWAERVAKGEHQMTMNNVWNWGDPVIGVHRSYLSTNRVGAIWTNNSGYNNPDVDAILDKAGQAVDEAERREIYVEFQDAIAEDVPIYWLNDTTFWQAYPSSMQNPPLGIWGQMSPMHEMSLG